ncbi:hypothetical protein HDV02_005819, partial [Globomyces sp. JEL0801]
MVVGKFDVVLKEDVVRFGTIAAVVVVLGNVERELVDVPVVLILDVVVESMFVALKVTVEVLNLVEDIVVVFCRIGDAVDAVLVVIEADLVLIKGLIKVGVVVDGNMVVVARTVLALVVPVIVLVVEKLVVDVVDLAAKVLLVVVVVVPYIALKKAIVESMSSR